jgi:hypothetical protein
MSNITDNYSQLCKYKSANGIRKSTNKISEYIMYKQVMKGIKDYLSNMSEKRLDEVLKKNRCYDLDELLLHHKIIKVKSEYLALPIEEILTKITIL